MYIIYMCCLDGVNERMAARLAAIRKYMPCNDLQR